MGRVVGTAGYERFRSYRNGRTRAAIGGAEIHLAEGGEPDEGALRGYTFTRMREMPIGSFFYTCISGS